MPSLKPDRIAGVGGLSTRHDSMVAGETGADYVLFGEPDAQRRTAVGRSDRRAAAMVGRIVRAALRRLCRLARGGARIRRSRRGFRAGRRFHLGRSARRGGGADGGRAGDQAGARGSVRKSQSRTGIRRNEVPASHIDPGELAAAAGDRAPGADLADAAAPAQPTAEQAGAKKKRSQRAEAESARRRQEAPQPAATPKPAATPTPTRDAPRPPSRIPMSIWSTAPISAACTRPRSISR